MGPDEVDTKITELEHRVERLRSLYEQYFMGIERIEPLVPRKDVDRRIYELRRAKLRNTARRFRLQTVIQRYNTFSQYWMRTCREIENGTYRRHRLKAKRRFGDAAPVSTQETPDDVPAVAAEVDATCNVPEAATPRAIATASTEQDLAAMLASDLDADEAIEAAFASLQAFGGPQPGRPPAPPARRAPTRSKASSLPAPNAAIAHRGGSGRAGSVRVGAKHGSLSTNAAPAPTPEASKPQAKPRSPRDVEAKAAAGKSDVDRIHRELMAARRRLNQAGQVSVAGLEKTLRATEKKLQAKHPGRRVEFRVAITNGKAALKPIIR